MPPAFNLSQDQTLKLNPKAKLKITDFNDSKVLALDLFALLPEPEDSGLAPDQAPTPIGCHLFKEHLLTSLQSFDCCFVKRGAHSTHLIYSVKLLKQIYFNRLTPLNTAHLAPHLASRCR